MIGQKIGVNYNYIITSETFLVI